MEEIISELDHSNQDVCEAKVMEVIDDQDESTMDFETEYEDTDNYGEDMLFYNMSVNGVFDDCSERYFPQFFADMGI